MNVSNFVDLFSVYFCALTGANSHNNHAAGGAYYDTVYTPSEPGSGGGGSNGGSGGSALWIDAPGTVWCDGDIISDGGNGINGVQSGGGAGGSIMLQTLKFRGLGELKTNGGAAYSGKYSDMSNVR